MDIATLLRAATLQLEIAGVASPRVDAELLLAHALGVDVAEVRRRAILGNAVGDALTDDDVAVFTDLLIRRANREPLQHLTGRAPFRHLELTVGPGVFIPRPETEVVAQVAIDEAKSLLVEHYPRGFDRFNRRPVIVDLCTGSGAIAAAVATEVPGCSVYAVELDAAAHRWAERNLADCGVVLIKGDARTALRELDGQVDVVVANPPYVPPGATPKDEEVARHDPAVALYGLGADGLEIPRGITAAAARLLKPGGLFVMEHAEVQAQAVREMVAALEAFETPTTRADLTGRPRMVIVRRRPTHARLAPK